MDLKAPLALLQLLALSAPAGTVFGQAFIPTRGPNEDKLTCVSPDGLSAAGSSRTIIHVILERMIGFGIELPDSIDQVQDVVMSGNGSTYAGTDGTNGFLVKGSKCMPLSLPEGTDRTFHPAVANDGSLTCFNIIRNAPPYRHAILTGDGAHTKIIHTPEGSISTGVGAISDSGEQLYGFVKETDDSNIRFAIWDYHQGFLMLLQPFPSTSKSTEVVISDAASINTTVVGYSESSPGYGFRWTSQDGFCFYDDSDGRKFEPKALSADGKRVVGSLISEDGTRQAAIGDDSYFESLVQFIRREYPILEADVQDWTLEVAEDISWDGKVIVGHGTDFAGRRKGWVLNLRSGNHDPYQDLR